MAREGNLEAPTRHLIDWKGPDYYYYDDDEAATCTGLERIFDICHGCRRCMSLCGSFPTLFDLVDESKSIEVDGVDKQDYWRVVAHNAVPYVLVEKEKCCGMPKLELGDLDSMNTSKEANIPVLAKYARDGLLKTEFPQAPGKISYQIPRHGRVQNIGKKTEEMLKMVPGTSVHTHERCSGQVGTFGMKKATHQQAMKIRKPLFKAMANHKDGGAPDVISSDCPLGGHHIAQGFEVNQLGAVPQKHPLTLIREAYGPK